LLTHIIAPIFLKKIDINQCRKQRTKFSKISPKIIEMIQAQDLREIELEAQN
jgi:hypothetical protein